MNNLTDAVGLLNNLYTDKRYILIHCKTLLNFINLSIEPCTFFISLRHIRCGLLKPRILPKCVPAAHK